MQVIMFFIIRAFVDSVRVGEEDGNTVNGKGNYWKEIIYIYLNLKMF